MTDKVYKIDEYDYFNVAKGKKDDGDLVGSLTILRNIEESGTRNLEVYAMMGEIYFEMELYPLALEYWFKYLAGSNRTDVRLRAYNALGATFCMLGDNYLMGYYYDLEFSLNPAEEQPYDYVLYDYLDYNKQEFPEFYVTYPLDKMTSKALYVSALDLLEKGNVSEAIERLSLIKPQDEEYDDAVFRLGSIYRDQGKSEEEMKAFLFQKYEQAIDKGRIALLLCEFVRTDDKKELLSYLDVALDSEPTDPQDCFYMARLYARVGEYDGAVQALNLALDINYYDVRSIYLYAVISYNVGKYDIAAEYFKEGYDISRDQINLFYYELCRDEKARAQYPELSIDYALPESESIERITEIVYLITGGKNKIRRCDADKLIKLAEFGLSFASHLVEDMVKEFIVYGPAKVKKYFISKLLSESVRNTTKMHIVEGLCLSGYDKKVDVVFDNVFLKVKLYKSDFDDEPDAVFNAAYALAVSRMFPFLKDLSEIRRAAYDVYVRLFKHKRHKKIKDANALAAVFALKVSAKNLDYDHLEKLFKTKRDDVAAIMALLEDN